jgi:hypothetical protein
LGRIVLPQQQTGMKIPPPRGRAGRVTVISQAQAGSGHS